MMLQSSTATASHQHKMPLRKAWKRGSIAHSALALFSISSFCNFVSPSFIFFANCLSCTVFSCTALFSNYSSLGNCQPLCRSARRACGNYSVSSHCGTRCNHITACSHTQHHTSAAITAQTDPEHMTELITSSCSSNESISACISCSCWPWSDLRHVNWACNCSISP